MQNINSVVVTGNLTRDPELRATGSGTSICSMRVAVNGRKKNATGEWVDDPNFFDVTVFGTTAENCARYLSKGRPAAIDGRLDWQEWTDRESGRSGRGFQIIADTVQFLGGRDDGDAAAGFSKTGFSGPRTDSPQPDWTSQDFRSAPAPAAPADDDIPF